MCRTKKGGKKKEKGEKRKRRKKKEKGQKRKRRKKKERGEKRKRRKNFKKTSRSHAFTGGTYFKCFKRK